MEASAIQVKRIKKLKFKFKKNGRRVIKKSKNRS